MRKEISTWFGFKPGDVVVEVTSGPGPVIVERQAPPSAFGTATVDGEVHRGFLTSGAYFVYPSEEGSASTRNYEHFTIDPDWKAAVDAYARGFQRVRVAVDQFEMGPGTREGLHYVLNQVYDERAAVVPEILDHHRLVDVIAQVQKAQGAMVTAGPIAKAVEILLKHDLGIETSE